MIDRHAALTLDELIPLLRARAADPERRTTARPGAFFAKVRSMDVGDPLATGPADPARIAELERSLVVTLPLALRRVYAEVADGRFGPGEGILPLSSVKAVYRGLRSPDAMPRGRSWPDGLLPLVAMEPGWDCVEAATGRVVAWDPEDLSGRASAAAFARSFREIFPSVEAWLTDWEGSRTQAEAQAELVARFTSPER